MPRAGDTLVNPVTGFRLRFLRTAADTQGALLELEATYAPNGAPPPEHLHPRQEERFEILRGSVRSRVAGETRDLHAGDTLVIPAGVPHAMWNAQPTEACVHWETRPALRTEALFETLMTLAARGRVDARGVPGLLDLAVLVPRYRDELRVTRPPAVVQRVVFGLLAPLARILGRHQPLHGAPPLMTDD